MKGDLHFSFSTLNMLRTCSHCWINKMMGIKAEQTTSMTEGKDGHKILQGHLSGQKKDDRLKWLEENFPIVETRDFDPLCKFDITVEGYSVIGYLDAQDPDRKRFGEIKLSSTPWSLKKFQDSPQRKIYSLAFPQYETAVLFTGSKNPDEWCKSDGSKGQMFVFDVPCTQRDRDEAEQWIKEALKIFMDGDFNGGLDQEGRCVERYCPWGNNCHFKHI